MKTKLTILFLLLVTTMMAQELKVKTFTMDMTDLSAQTNPVRDYNGEICALVKVDLVVPDATFKGDTIKTEYKDGIYSIYLTPGATYLEINAPKVHALSYTFPRKIEGGVTYSLVVNYPFSNENAKEAVKGADQMQFKTIKARHTSMACDRIISIQYPMGESFADNTIREWINEQLGGRYTGSLNNGKALADFYANEKELHDLGILTKEEEEEIKAEFNEYSCESISTLSDSIYVIYESRKLVTICDVCCNPGCGGNGCICGWSYITVRKADGRVLGEDMLNEKIHNPEFKRLLINGLKTYFGVSTDKELLEILVIGDFKELDLPQELKMYIDGNYVVLVYGYAEITCNANGYVESRIPIEKMRPYLKTTMRTLFD